MAATARELGPSAVRPGRGSPSSRRPSTHSRRSRSCRSHRTPERRGSTAGTSRRASPRGCRRNSSCSPTPPSAPAGGSRINEQRRSLRAVRGRGCRARTARALRARCVHDRLGRASVVAAARLVAAPRARRGRSPVVRADRARVRGDRPVVLSRRAVDSRRGSLPPGDAGALAVGAGHRPDGRGRMWKALRRPSARRIRTGAPGGGRGAGTGGRRRRRAHVRGPRRLPRPAGAWVDLVIPRRIERPRRQPFDCAA